MRAFARAYIVRDNSLQLNTCVDVRVCTCIHQPHVAKGRHTGFYVLFHDHSSASRLLARFRLVRAYASSNQDPMTKRLPFIFFFLFYVTSIYLHECIFYLSSVFFIFYIFIYQVKENWDSKVTYQKILKPHIEYRTHPAHIHTFCKTEYQEQCVQRTPMNACIKTSVRLMAMTQSEIYIKHFI